MKICPHCEVKNKDQYLYCVGCSKPLPKQSHLDNLMSLAIKEINQGNYRKAVNYLDSVLKLNIGNKEAWFLKGIAMSNLGVGGEAKECFKSAGIDIREKTCAHCMASKNCLSCNQTGVCFMCKGRRRCSMCGGSGNCYSCGGVGCRNCKDTGECNRCKGTGKCVYCDNSGICPDCRGHKNCGFCGGTGMSLEIRVESVPKSVRQYLKLKK